MPKRLTVYTALLTGLLGPALVQAAPSNGNQQKDVAQFVRHYIQSLAQSDVERWAASDLGCLSRFKVRPAEKAQRLSPETARRCWDDTLKAHADMVAQQAESGVFSATGRGVGLGLLHDRHRATETWKEYPPAVFVSPAVILRDQAPVPQTLIVRTSPPQPMTLAQANGAESVTVPGQAVDVKVVYSDPLTAPLALRPEEVWWVNGAQRQFGPVREVVARFIVVSGLRKHGYLADRAVLNEALPGAPLIPTTHYGLRPEAGRRYDHVDSAHAILKGELLAGSPRWWDKADAEPFIRTAMGRAAHLPANERAGLLTRLLLIDPTDPEVHALRGDDSYQAFLKQAVTKGGLAARDEPALQRIAELYWTIQAQTWRQELTAVSEGYEPAADALYRAIASYEAVAQRQRATAEQRRRLGLLTRWNNDPTAALAIHQALLGETQPDTAEYGRVLAEIAWDRIQWVSWERRYDHPWLTLANTEAGQAAGLLANPYDQIHAHYAQVAVESLLTPRELDRFHSRLHQIKHDLDRIPGVKGLQGQLLANDLVKALTPESAAIVLPTPPRSLEVLDVAVHAKPPKQDIVWQWNFDRDVSNTLPAGFLAISTPGADTPDWQVQADSDAPTPGRLVAQNRPCATADCAHLLVADRVRTRYPDVAVQINAASNEPHGGAGLALAILDGGTFYAVTLNASTGVVTTRRVDNGQTTVLGEVPVKLAARPWHTMRVQRINFLHLDKGRLGVFIDGAQVAAVDDVVLPADGRIGLVTFGPTAAKFDGLHVLDLVSNTTFSGPAAY